MTRSVHYQVDVSSKFNCKKIYFFLRFMACLCIFIALFGFFVNLKLCTTVPVNKGFIKANEYPKIGEKLDLNEISDVHSIVMSLLSNCTLTSMPGLGCLGQCVGWCQLIIPRL